MTSDHIRPSIQFIGLYSPQTITIDVISQDSLRVPLSLLHRGKRETYAEEDQRTRQGYTTHPELTVSEHAQETGHYHKMNKVKFNLLIEILHGTQIHVWSRKLSTKTSP